MRGGGVAEAWLIDLAAGSVEVHREPGEDGYAARRIHRPGEPIALAAVPELEVDPAALLP